MPNIQLSVKFRMPNIQLSVKFKTDKLSASIKFDTIQWKNRSRMGQCAGADWDTFDAAKLMIFSETVAF